MNGIFYFLKKEVEQKILKAITKGKCWLPAFYDEHRAHNRMAFCDRFFFIVL